MRLTHIVAPGEHCRRPLRIASPLELVLQGDA